MFSSVDGRSSSVDDRPSSVDDQWTDLNVEVFVMGDGRSFLTELVFFHACSCSLWSDGYPVVGLSASSIPILASNGARRRSNLPKAC